MNQLTNLAIQLAKRYVEERGVEGTVQDAVGLCKGARHIAKSLFGSYDVDDELDKIEMLREKEIDMLEKHEDDDLDEYEDDELDKIEKEILREKEIDMLEKHEDDDLEEYEDDDLEEYETNCFDDETLNVIGDTIEEHIEDGEYESALYILKKYYTECDVDFDFFYFFLKANIFVERYSQKGRSYKSDSSHVIEVEEAIEACKEYEEKNQKDLTLKLEEKFEDVKSKIRYWCEMASLNDEIVTLCNPEFVITTSKVNDILRAFELLEDFWNEECTGEDGTIYDIDIFFMFKVQIYNAFFSFLTKSKQELNALSDEQLSDYYSDAMDCVKKVILCCEDDVMTEEDEELNERIPEVIEELKQLRQGKDSSTTLSPSASLTSEEQEYLEEIKACLEEDGEITSKERRLLDRLRKSLGITEARAKELEDSIDDLSDDEKEYQEELKACLEDGTISDRERRLLNRIRKSLGITEERAKEIENRLLS